MRKNLPEGLTWSQDLYRRLLMIRRAETRNVKRDQLDLPLLKRIDNATMYLVKRQKRSHNRVK